MYYHKIILLSLALMLLVTASEGQVRFATGMQAAPEKYDEVPVLPIYSGRKYNELPLKVSLRKYCPVPGDQKGAATCVGWAVGYGAMTIMRAIQEGKTDQASITKEANSAAFIYNQIKISEEDCNSGAYLEDALQFVSTYGDCLESSFLSTEINCTVVPGVAQQSEATKFRIQDFAAVFKQNEPEKGKLSKVCKILATQTPVIAGLEVGPSFWQILPGNALWNPAPGETGNGYHAMVVIGYDNVEKRVELMNSFGPGWGQGGFIWMPYDDFERYLQFAFVLNAGHGSTQEERVAVDDTPALQLSGEFIFRRPAGYLTLADGSETPFFEEVPVSAGPFAGTYLPVEKNMSPGEVFQLVAREIPKGRYVYVFSQGPDGEVNLHFPKFNAGNRTADFVLSQTSEIIIPSEENVLQLTAPGKDHLCVLYATRKIMDISERLRAFRQVPGPFQDRVSAVFGDLLIPLEDIALEPEAMSFSTAVPAQSRKTTVAITLLVNCE